ncbi:hypothetical protein [Pedococcus sp. P5_B7]
MGALTGCTSGADDPPATGNGTAVTGVTTTASSSSSPPTTTRSATPATTAAVQIPEAARAHTEAGAEAFVRFFLEQVNVAWTRPQSGLLPPLGDSGCLSCKGFEMEATELVAEHHRYAKAPALFTKVTAFGGVTKEGRRRVRIIGVQQRVDIVDRSGKVVSTDLRKPIAVTAMTMWQGDRWLLWDMG